MAKGDKAWKFCIGNWVFSSLQSSVVSIDWSPGCLAKPLSLLLPPACLGTATCKFPCHTNLSQWSTRSTIIHGQLIELGLIGSLGAATYKLGLEAQNRQQELSEARHGKKSLVHVSAFKLHIVMYEYRLLLLWIVGNTVYLGLPELQINWLLLRIPYTLQKTIRISIQHNPFFGTFTFERWWPVKEPPNLSFNTSHLAKKLEQ